MTSGAKATSSAACLCILSASPPRERYSISRLLPSVHPSFASAPRNAATIACRDGSSSIKPANMPMRRMRSACCARAATGHVAAAPPMTLMKSRRLMQPPRLGQEIVATLTCAQEGADVRFGSEADICSVKGQSALHPIATVKADIRCPLRARSRHLRITYQPVKATLLDLFPDKNGHTFTTIDWAFVGRGSYS